MELLSPESTLCRLQSQWRACEILQASYPGPDSINITIGDCDSLSQKMGEETFSTARWEFLKLAAASGIQRLLKYSEVSVSIPPVSHMSV